MKRNCQTYILHKYFITILCITDRGQTASYKVSIFEHYKWTRTAATEVDCFWWYQTTIQKTKRIATFECDICVRVLRLDTTTPNYKERWLRSL